jgi:hypothetical protein
MSSCGLDAAHWQMMQDAMHALHGTHLRVVVPSQMEEASDSITHILSQASHNWSERAFGDMGRDLGLLLREVMMKCFPQRYSLGMQGEVRHAVGFGVLLRLLAVGFGVSAFLFALVVVRRVTSWSRSGARVTIATVERFDDVEAATPRGSCDVSDSCIE